MLTRSNSLSKASILFCSRGPTFCSNDSNIDGDMRVMLRKVNPSQIEASIIKIEL